MPAPPLVNSKRAGNRTALINILLHGLSGPVNDKTYSDVMAPLGISNTDEWVANVLSYVHYRFKPRESEFAIVAPDDVKRIREATDLRTELWTIAELEKVDAMPAVKKEMETTAKPEKKKTTAVKSTPPIMTGKLLLTKLDCKSCHKPDVKLVGPSYKAIAQKYKPTEATVNALAAKIIAGGAGNWGQVPMTPHATLPTADARKMVRYILSLSGK